MKIHAYDKTITNIFSPEAKYIIPRFQREYSWTSDEIIEFWNDILENIEENEGKYINKEYFIGSLVLVEKDEQTFLIVDGQQRLTTITILFSALIESFLEIKQNGMANGLYKYVEGSDLKSEKFFKLVNENPKPFFQKSIQNITKDDSIDPDTEEERLLYKAYNYFYTKLKELKKGKSEEEYIKYLTAIRSQLLGLKTIFISVSNIDEAYTIFETLNSKGISLTTTDLIKNDIFRVLNAEHPVDDAKDKWKIIQSNTKSRHKDMSINTFIRHYWLSKYEFITQGRLYKSYKKLSLNSIAEMSEFLNSLVLESKIYNQISYPNINDWKQQEEKQVYYSLDALYIFRVTQVKTLLLSLIAQKNNGIVSLSQLKACVRILENFHFIFTAITSERASGLESKYSTYARQMRSIKNKSKTNELIKDLSEYLKSKLPSYEEFEKGFFNLQYLDSVTSDKKLVQYIFKRYEEHLLKTEELIPANFTLEHIMPQSTKIAQVGKIGNLIPLDKKLNEQANNGIFQSKIKIFKQSKLKTVNEFVEKYETCESWAEEHIIERTKALANISFFEIWQI